jgi:hypothetical protein
MLVAERRKTVHNFRRIVINNGICFAVQNSIVHYRTIDVDQQTVNIHHCSFDVDQEAFYIYDQTICVDHETIIHQFTIFDSFTRCTTTPPGSNTLFAH